MKIDISRIDPHPGQPRKHFAGIDALAESIRTNGLIEPITVRPVEDRYQIVAGERRWRAARIAGLREIDAQVKTLSDDEVRTIALVENLQRSDLTPTEEAAAYHDLQERGWTQTRIAAAAGKTQSYVAHKIGLLKLPGHLRYYLDAGLLTKNHLRQIAKLRNLYPPGLEAAFSPELHRDLIRDEIRASLFLLQLRPFGEAAGCMFAVGPAQTEGLRQFADHVLKHTGTVPQWQAAGHWWAAFASAAGLTVTELAKGIDNWQVMYESALINFGYLRSAVSDTPGDESAYWGFWADLRQNRSLGLMLTFDEREHDEKTIAWYVNVLARVIQDPGMVLPSNLQRIRAEVTE